MFNYLRDKSPDLRFPVNISNDTSNLENEFIYPRWAWCSYEWDEKTQNNVARTCDYLKRTLELCREKDVKVAVTGVPHFEQYALDPGTGQPLWSDRPHREIKKIAENTGAFYFDSFEYLKPYIAAPSRQNTTIIKICISTLVGTGSGAECISIS